MVYGPTGGAPAQPSEPSRLAHPPHAPETGGELTVKVTPFDVWPPVVTVTRPVAAPDGTVVAIVEPFEPL
jgi:hypothetical protein